MKSQLHGLVFTGYVSFEIQNPPTHIVEITTFQWYPAMVFHMAKFSTPSSIVLNLRQLKSSSDCVIKSTLSLLNLQLKLQVMPLEKHLPTPHLLLVALQLHLSSFLPAIGPRYRSNVQLLFLLTCFTHVYCACMIRGPLFLFFLFLVLFFF